MKGALRGSTSIYSISSIGSRVWPHQPLIDKLLLLPSPLKSILDDIDLAIRAGLYYPALTVALTLPDICVGLTLQGADFVTKRHYVDFVDKYTKPGPTEKGAGLGMSGLDCYQLRGGVIHRGNAAGHPHWPNTHAIFTTPNSGATLHGFSMQSGQHSAAMFDLEIFCSVMKRAVQSWYLDNFENPKVVANLEMLLRWRPTGVYPFVGGAPVIASGPTIMLRQNQETGPLAHPDTGSERRP